jgi:streptogramin lyase
MRFALAVAVCGGLVLAGCGGSSTGSGGPAPVLPPTANAGGPYTGTAGTPVSFTGSASNDPQNQALTYQWNFGDGCGVQSNGYICATGVSPTHTYAQAPGQASTVYSVTVTVQDTSGYSGQASTTATIRNLTLPDATLTGTVATGSTPIVAAHVYLFAVSTGPGGTGSTSLLSAMETGTSDLSGNAYVVTGTQGNFTMTGAYTCTSGQQLYIYAIGGTAGTQSIPNAGLMAVVGSCPAVGTTVIAQVNEVSTIAAAYAMAGFATDALRVASSGTALAQVGVANAFANAANLVKLSTGVALTTTPAGNGTVPQTQIDALANILSVCVNPTNYVASNCSSLLGDALANGTSGNAPTDTATAAINIAHNAGSGLNSDIYNITGNVPGYTPVYLPTLSRQPNDFTLAISYSGGGLSGPQGVAVDGSGNVWVTNDTVAGVTKLSSAGAVATGSPFTGGGLSLPYGIAIDTNGNAWIANNTSGSVTEFPATFPTTGTASNYTVCNLSGPKGIAIDGSNDVWIPDNGHNDVCELSSTGALVSPGAGYTGGGLNGPQSIAIDGSGNAWVANYAGGSVTKFSSLGVVQSGSNGYMGSGLHDPDGIAMDKSGNAWVADFSPTNATEIFATTGTSSPLNNSTLSSPVGVAVDGAGNVWVASQSGNTVTEYSNGGVVLSGANGYGGAAGTASGIAVDGSGDVWVGNLTGNSVTEYVGAAAPVVTPLALAVKNNALGSRP